MDSILTAAQRQQALREVATAANDLGMPEAVYVAEHGVTILANLISAAKWSLWAKSAPQCCGTVTVTQVTPLGVSA